MTTEPLMRVEATDLSRTFRTPGAVHALREVSLRIAAGEIVSIEGPSGSGKSTLLHLLAGLDRPDHGRVLIDGTDLIELNEPARTTFRRRNIGLVLQSPDLLASHDALDNVAVPAILDGMKVPHARSRAQAMLDLVRLHDRSMHRPHQLSGGEQQRACIARALINEPVVVFADEPTATLDSATGDEILRVLRDVADTGPAVLLATHDPRAAAQTDRTIRLVDGTLVWPERDLRPVQTS